MHRWQSRRPDGAIVKVIRALFTPNPDKVGGGGVGPTYLIAPTSPILLIHPSAPRRQNRRRIEKRRKCAKKLPPIQIRGTKVDFHKSRGVGGWVGGGGRPNEYRKWYASRFRAKDTRATCQNVTTRSHTRMIGYRRDRNGFSNSMRRRD